MKKIENSKRSGTSADEVYTPTLWYFDLLLFTIDQELPTESVSNMTETQTENFATEETQQSDIQEECEDDGSELNNTQVSVFVGSFIYKLSFSLNISSCQLTFPTELKYWV